MEKNKTLLTIIIMFVCLAVGITAGYFIGVKNGKELLEKYKQNETVKDDYGNNNQNLNDNKSIELLKDSDFLTNGIYPGLTKKEIVSMLGKDFTESDKSGSLYEINYSDLGIKVYLNTDTDISEKIVLYKDNIVTARGIKVSSSVNDVISSFNNENMQIYYIKDGEFFDGLYSGSDKEVIQYVEIGFKGFIRYEMTKTNKILFEIKNSKVSNITIGHGAE